MKAIVLAAAMCLVGVSGARAWYETIQCVRTTYCGYWAPGAQVCTEPSYATFCEVWRTFPSGASYPVRWYWLGAHR